MKNKKSYVFVLLLSLFFSVTSCKNDTGLNSLDPIEELCIIKSDGSDLRVIAEGGAYYTFLPDSDEVLYTGGNQGLNGLYRIKADGSGNTQLINNMHTIWGFSVAPNNRSVVMTSYDGIYLMDLNTRVVRLIFASDGRPIRNASFSANMSQIVFQNNYDIMTITSNGSAGSSMIKKETEFLRYMSPGFTSNDSLIIYLGQEKKADLPLYNLRAYSLTKGSDSPLTRVKTVPISSDNILTARDGRIVVNTGEAGAKDSIKIIDLKNNFRTISLDAGYNYSFSPDESKVVYLNAGNIYMINTDGTNRHLIYSEANSLVSIGQPQLSYDGKYILFGRSRQQK